MDRELFQREAAKMIGVHTATVRNWERGHSEPAIDQWPGLIRFLGSIPFSIGESLPERLLAYRRIHGLSQVALSATLLVDESTVNSWETGEYKPDPVLRYRVEKLLSELGMPDSHEEHHSTLAPVLVPGTGTEPLTPEDIKIVRIAKGMHRVDFARLLGVSKSTVQRWETGEGRPSRPSRVKLWRVMGYSPTEIVEELKKFDLAHVSRADMRRMLADQNPFSPAEFKELRLAKGIQIKDLARNIGVHKGSIWRWESGKTVPPDRFRIRLAEVLGDRRQSTPTDAWLEEIDTRKGTASR